MNHKILLGVNIDHAATLRQVRGATTAYPNLLTIVQLAKKGGANQITIHLREDRRHIQDADVVLLCKKSALPINLEMAVSSEMLKIALNNRPAWVCFVPEKREELTTEGGLNIQRCFSAISKMTATLKSKNIQSSFFIEPSLEQVKWSAQAKADAVEFHTGHWVLAKGANKKMIWNQLVVAAKLAHSLGLRVHAGHGLDYRHAKLIKKLPHLVEVNIGHSLVCYALEDGFQRVTKKMKHALKK